MNEDLFTFKCDCAARMQENLWQASDGLKDLHMYEVLDSDNHSKLHKIRKKGTIGYYALRTTDKSQRLSLLQEVRALHSLSHKNVLKFYMWYETNNHLWTVTEYCVGGDLEALIKLDGRLPEPSVHDIGRDLARALQHVHANSIVHCGLRPSSVLLDEDGCVKLADFRQSRSAQQSSDAGHAAHSAPSAYTAPEVLVNTQPQTFASDLWSLGCILYEMAAGRPPLDGGATGSQIEGSEQAESYESSLSELPGAGCSPMLIDLLKRLLTKDPASRITWPELCTHGFWDIALESLELPAVDCKRAAQQPTLSTKGASKVSPHQDDMPDATELSRVLTAKDIEVTAEDSEGRVTHDGGVSTANDAFPAGHRSGEVIVSPEVHDSTDASALIWPLSDLCARPIVPTKWAIASDNPRFRQLGLPDLANAVDLSSPMCRQYGDQLTAALFDPQIDKVLVLEGMQRLCIGTMTANVLVNSRLAGALVSMLQTGLPLRVRELAAVNLGLLVRYATVIQAGFEKSGVVNALAVALAADNHRVRRRSMAALGEWLFFIASQEQDEECNIAQADPEGVFEAVCSLLHPRADEVAQHYALKTIENIAQTKSSWTLRFATKTVADSLWRIMQVAHSSVIQTTAASALSRLLRHSRGLLRLLENPLTAHDIVSGLRRADEKWTTVNLSILCAFISEGICSPRAPLAEADHLGPSLLAFLRCASSVGRGKILLSFALLIQNAPTLACHSATITAASQAARCEIADQYERECAHQLLAQLPNLFLACLNQMPVAITGRNGPKENALLRAAISNLVLTQPVFKRAVDARFITQLAREFAALPQSAHIVQQAEALLQYCEIVCADAQIVTWQQISCAECLLPAIASTLSSECKMPNVHLGCLCLLCSLAPRLLAANEGWRSNVETAIVSLVLPHATSLLKQQEPIPLNFLKLLAVLLEGCPDLAAHLSRVGVVQHCLSFLELHHPNNRVCNLVILHALMQQGVVSSHDLESCHVTDKLGRVLEYASDNAAEVFMEPVLQLLCSIQDHLEQRLQSQSEAKDHELLRGIVKIIPTLLALCAHEQGRISTAAAECLAKCTSTLATEVAEYILSEQGVAQLGLILALDPTVTTAPVQGELLGVLLAVLSTPRYSSAAGAQGKMSSLTEVLETLHNKCRNDETEISLQTSRKAAQVLSKLLTR